MKINAEFIRTLNPCEEGIVNFETKYPYFEGSLVDVLELENIPYSDKVWLAIKVTSDKQLQKWSLRCAKSVVHIYNREFPNDNTLNEVLDTVEKVINGELDESAARSAAESAWSAVRSAAESAWSSARSAVSEREQEKLNIKLLIEVLNEQ